jgi:hypothetical protein
MRIIELGNPGDTQSIHRSGGLSTPARYETAPDNKEAIAKAGQRAWSLIHRYRGCDPVFFEAWMAWVPQGCSCKSDLSQRIKDHPPDFSSAEAFFEWGVDLHNWVNEKLLANGDTTKRTFTIEEARNQWRRE